MELNGTKLNNLSFFWKAYLIRQIKHYTQITEDSAETQTFSSLYMKAAQ